jgi:hypothetical protein
MGRSQDDFKKGAWTTEVGRGGGEVAARRLGSCGARGSVSWHHLATPLPTISAQEDELLRQLIAEYGPKNWSIIANGIKGRSGKSCRLRWVCSSAALAAPLARLHAAVVGALVAKLSF